MQGKRFPYAIALANVRSAHNVGAILRTADGAGVTCVHTIGYTPMPNHPKVVKTALGAEKTVTWQHHESWDEFVDYAASINQTLVGVEVVNNATNLFEAEAEQNSIFVFGNEVLGLSDQEMQSVSQFVSIPMWGAKGSLSVYVAAAVVMYTVSHKFEQNNNFKNIDLLEKI